LGEILLRDGSITEDLLDLALAQQQVSGQRLGEVLLSINAIRASDLLRAVAEQIGVAYIDLDSTPPDANVISLISPSLARRLKAVPVSLNKGVLAVAMANPADVVTMDDIKMAVGASKVVPMLADLAQLDGILSRLGGGERAMAEALQRAVEEVDTTPIGPAAEVKDGPIVEFVDRLLTLAMRERASDVHIEPTEGDTRVRFRVDGVLREAVTAPRDLHSGLVSRIKISAELNIAERRIPQDGRMTLQLQNGESADMRVATLPTVYGESIAIRLIIQDKRDVRLDNLGFLPEPLARLKECLQLPHGATVVTGPTGSGKTTTLYAALKHLNDASRNILTVEDPVENYIHGVKQVQVNPKAGLTFATALRSFLRSDPDVVLIGEIRDLETATIAVEASITGHQVLSSLHTNNAASTPLRLVEMGLEPFYVIGALNCVVAQRLARLLCDNCKEESRATESEVLMLHIPEDLHNTDGSFTVYRPVGCASCSSTGYRGRFAVHEVMVVDDTIRELIAERAPSATIEAAAVRAGMWTLRMDGLRKVRAGVSSLQEVMRVVI